VAYGKACPIFRNGDPPAWPVGRRSEFPGALGGFQTAATGTLWGGGPGEANIESDRKSDEMGRM
jgi:hypothetical protein